MRHTAIVAVLTSAFLVSGCQKTESEKETAGDKTAIAEEPGSDASGRTSRDGDRETPTEEAETVSSSSLDGHDGESYEVAGKASAESRKNQCDSILERCFVAAKPALEMLKIEITESLEDEYRQAASVFIDRCQKLKDEEIECLMNAANPISGIDTCRINEGKKSTEKLFTPDFSDHIKLYDVEKVSDGQSKKILKRLRGKWVNNWKEARTHITWTIKKNGEVAQRKKGPGDRTEQKHFKISFDYRDRMTVHWSENSSQHFAFFMPSRRVFFASGNLTYNFYPVKDRRKFFVRDSGDYIFFENGRCTVVNERGLMTEGNCEFVKKGRRRVFEANWQYPGQVFLNGSPRVLKRRFDLIGKHLVDERLVKSGKFKKI